MVARVIKANIFILITLSKEDGSEIVLSWSDVYAVLEKVKELANIQSCRFYETYPIKREVINNANERHFWAGGDKYRFELSELENISEYEFEEYSI